MDFGCRDLGMLGKLRMEPLHKSLPRMQPLTHLALLLHAVHAEPSQRGGNEEVSSSLSVSPKTPVAALRVTGAPAHCQRASRKPVQYAAQGRRGPAVCTRGRQCHRLSTLISSIVGGCAVCQT